jgi:serine/threonine-protein kinase RsbT
VENGYQISIRSDADIVTARRIARELAVTIGFSGSDPTIIATAVSEVARNIVQYAREGEIILRVAVENGRRGIEVTARDDGPGITDTEKAMQDGYSTGYGLGLGLPGTKRLVDRFEIHSTPGNGTTITMIKWAASDGNGRKVSLS